jgi:hypothetical protein
MDHYPGDVHSDLPKRLYSNNDWMESCPFPAKRSREEGH